MKILTGKFKDVSIPFRAQAGLRPTPDRVRKAVIDALSPGWEGARVLDLYAGTGAMGIEMLSAGAASAVFVESDHKRAASIETALEPLKTSDAFVVVEKAAAALPRIVKKMGPFDRVWSDPPYEKGLALETLDFFRSGEGLCPAAWVVVECYKKEVLPKTVGRLSSRRVALYGDTAVHYYILI